MKQTASLRLRHGQHIRELRGFGTVRFGITEFDRQRPGLYDSPQTAALAFEFADDELVEIQRSVVRRSAEVGFSGNFRPIAASDLVTYREASRSDADAVACSEGDI